ncbi:MAG: DUF2752 domain-containing protein [Desulfomonilaceae bacterium]
MSDNDVSMPRIEHLWILALALIALVGSCLLNPLGNSGLCLTVPLSDTRLPLPNLCWSRSLLGISCPGCGLTRSFAAMARGEICTSWRLNHCGPMLFVLCCLQVPYRVLAYFNVARAAPLLRTMEEHGHFITWFVAAALIVAWLARLL